MAISASDSPAGFLPLTIAITSSVDYVLGTDDLGKGLAVGKRARRVLQLESNSQRDKFEAARICRPPDLR
jgi:hypothetical protein